MKKLLVFVFVCASIISRAQGLCAGSSLTLTAASPASLTGMSYSINPGGLPSSNGIFVVSPTVTTTYTLYTNGTTAQNTPGSTSVVTTVTVFQQPIVTPSYTNATCTSTANGMNLNLTFSPAGPSPTYAIAWAATTGTIPNVPTGITNSTQYSVTGGISSGPYQATITSAGGCSVVVAFTITPQPAPASFSLTPGGTTFSITCYNPFVTLNTSNPNNTYTWTSASLGALVTPSLTIGPSNAGSITIAGTNTISGCTSTKTISVVVNTTIPQANVTPTNQNITCQLSSITTVTMTAISPTLNITHVITPPQGGAFTANTFTAAYAPQGGTGTYSYCLIDNANGCTVCKNFTVTSSQGYPTFSIQSNQNFTLGCNATSVCVINVINASTQPISGGALSYTFLPPGTSTVTNSGTLSAISSISVNVPGTWTVITKDNSSLCESRVPLSIIQNTVGPKLDTVLIPYNILDCDKPTVKLEAVSETPNISYNWSFPGNPGNLPTPTINVNANYTVASTTTLIANYTITLKDNSNTCITTSVVPMYQNIFKPNVLITSGGTSVITCATPTVVLTNISTTGIPPTSIFPRSQPVIGFIWQGPSPQVPGQINTTYLAATVGTYTLTGKDLNNGCLNTGTVAIGDNRIYPEIELPIDSVPFIDCGAPGVLLNPIYKTPITLPSYTWTPPAFIPGGILTNSNCLASIAGVYTLVAKNGQNGCATKFTMRAVQGVLTASVAADRLSGFAPLPVNFSNNSFSSASFTNTAVKSTTGIVTAWSFGNSTYTTTPSVSITAQTTFSLPGTYLVTAFLTKNPCVASYTALVRVEAPSKLEVPNVFTPNGDNVNDYFILHTTNLITIAIKIYDRWGHKVYDLESSKGNIEWDGKNQLGVECAPGTYFYVLTSTGSDGVSHDSKGTISLFR